MKKHTLKIARGLYDRFFPKEVVCVYQNPLPVVQDAMPLGSFAYTHWPREGVYRVCGYRDVSRHYTHGHAFEVVGRLVLRTQFGYPDDANRGYFVAEVLNKKKSFGRSRSGRWEVRHKNEPDGETILRKAATGG